MAKELDDSVSKLTISKEILSDVSPLPLDDSEIHSHPMDLIAGKDILRL